MMSFCLSHEHIPVSLPICKILLMNLTGDCLIYHCRNLLILKTKIYFLNNIFSYAVYILKILSVENYSSYIYGYRWSTKVFLPFTHATILSRNCIDYSIYFTWKVYLKLYLGLKRSLEKWIEFQPIQGNLKEYIQNQSKQTQIKK